jgi:hypothetical protein
MASSVLREAAAVIFTTDFYLEDGGKKYFPKLQNYKVKKITIITFNTAKTSNVIYIS